MKVHRLVLAAALALGAAPTSASAQGGGPTIWQAVSRNDLAAVQSLLRRNPRLANAVDAPGNRPLNMAVHAGRWEMMKSLIRQGADVNGADGRGSTPLHMAIAWPDSPANRLAIVKYLVAHGADVRRRFTYRDTLLHFALDAPVARYLIGKGVPLNKRNTSWGLSPLHKAVGRMTKPQPPAQWRGSVELIRVLIRSGASVNLRDKKGRTPLDDAQLIPHARLRREVVSLLTGQPRSVVP